MKNCKQCHSPFEVTDWDRELLRQVSPAYLGEIYLIPEPTLCWQCKLQNRLSFRNERSLYKATCHFTGEPMISMYSEDKPYKIYHQDVWWSDVWEARDYGRDFDFSRPFFEQFEALLHEVPLMALWLINPQNSKFNNVAFGLKDSYMSVCSDMSERLLYAYGVDHSSDVLDSSYIKDSELVYECVDGENLYHCFFSQDLRHCSDVYFSYDLSGCRYCFGCEGLRNKEYYIFNQPVGKQGWENWMKDFSFTTSHLAKALKEFEERKLLFPRRANTILNCENVTGDYLYHSQNLENCYDVRKSADSKNVVYGPWGLNHVMDSYAVGEMSYGYEMMGGGVGPYKNAFVMNFSNGPTSTYYSMLMVNGTADCFGSIGLKRSRYCILNKQYSKSEYELLLPKIIQHMRETGEWGEFFPPSISMFGYNETKAQELFPLSQKEALQKAYRWSDYQKAKPVSEKKIHASELPESIDSIPDDILNWVIVCEDTGELFKVTKLELDFYRKLHLPVPRKSPNVRHLNRMKYRNSYCLWDRQCDKCSTMIQTTYFPDSPERVYCEPCYLSHIY